MDSCENGGEKRNRTYIDQIFKAEAVEWIWIHILAFPVLCVVCAR